MASRRKNMNMFRVMSRRRPLLWTHKATADLGLFVGSVVELKCEFVIVCWKDILSILYSHDWVSAILICSLCSWKKANLNQIPVVQERDDAHQYEPSASSSVVASLYVYG